MSFKSIFVPAIADDNFTPAMAAAVTMARAYHSHVVAAHVRMPFDLYPPAIHYPLEVDSWSAARDAHEESVKLLEESLKARYGEIVSAEKISELPYQQAVEAERETLSWQTFSGAVPEVLSRMARLSDLVVLVNKRQKLNASDRDIRDRLLSETGRPLLLVPEAGLAELPQSAVIGWNGSLEACRAIESAMPLLKGMKKVTLLTIGELGQYVPAAEHAALYLKAHHVPVECHTVEAPPAKTGACMVRALTDHDADILIMGAYSRHKWREVLFGGATQYILTHAEVPVFMAH